MRGWIVALVVPGIAVAGENVRIRHQARIIDTTGQPVSGVHEIRVGLWSEATAGSELWFDVFTAEVEHGYVALELGSDEVGHPLDGDLFDGSPRWLQVSVDGAALVARTEVTPVPYALHAVTVAQGVPVGTVLPFGGVITSLPDGWALCDGATVSDPGPGLRDFNAAMPGVQTPILTDNRFVMGVGIGSAGITGGRNDIPNDGSHTHSFSQTTADMAPDASHFTSGSFTNAAGGHTHGGENRPSFLGLPYIIRVR
jgi:hypothetical protein